MSTNETRERERELISVQEAAERYGVTIPAVRGWIRTGRIQSYEQKLPRRVYVDAREIERKREIKPKPARTQQRTETE